MQPWQPRLHRGEAGVERGALEKMELAQPPCRDPQSPADGRDVPQDPTSTSQAGGVRDQSRLSQDITVLLSARPLLWPSPAWPWAGRSTSRSASFPQWKMGCRDFLHKVGGALS